MMEASRSWISELSFTERFQHITSISSALYERDQSHESTVQQHAKDVETRYFDSASTLEEYRDLCQTTATLCRDVGDEASVHDDQVRSDLTPATVSIGNYSHAVHHANGIFSEVYRAPALPEPSAAEQCSSRFVALKVTSPSTMIVPHDSRKEVRILEHLCGEERIIPLIESFQLAGDRLVLVFPFMPCSLDVLLSKGVSEQKKARAILKDLLRGLTYTHHKGVIHRDVKPSCLLLQSPEGPACLSDFGISWSSYDPASEQPDEKITDVGTTCYRPPEILFGKRDYDYSLDMWAAGCVAAQVLSLGRKTLFEAGNVGTELALIQSVFMTLGTPNETSWPGATSCPDWGKMQWKCFEGKPWADLMPKASAQAQQLASGLVCFEPTNRLTAAAALKHAYFSVDID